MNFEPRVLAHMATGIENRDPDALAVLDALGPGHARIVGITGPPGAGKSTLVSAIATELRRQDKSVAVLAVDPTSRISGGAILGDRIRMTQHYADPGVFIRSIASRGASGGIARATADLARLMDAAGKDYVLIETMGVGQDEVEIARLAQITVVVLVPGMGDDVQAIKAGILEIADIFVINKADQPGAERMRQELRAALSLAPPPHPPIMLTVASEAKGIPELLDALEAVPDDPRHAPIAALPLEHAIAFYAAPGLAVKAQSVPSLAAAADQLRDSGGRLLNSPGDGKHLYVFVEAQAVLLELIQESPTWDASHPAG